MGRKWTAAATASVAVVALGAFGGPAVGGGATTSRGDFSALPAAAGRPESGLAGQAHAVRTADGRTRLSVELRGLQPGVTYGVHLHRAPCSAANPGGGHYMHDPAGIGQPPNELWPSSDRHDPLAGITANPAGSASGGGVADWGAGAEAASVVLHAGVGHGATTTAGGPKLACADLR
jgi:hypothetical protein